MFVYNRQLREAFNSMNTSNDGRLSLSDVSKINCPQRITIVIWKTKTDQLSQLEMLAIIMTILKNWLWLSVSMVFKNNVFSSQICLAHRSCMGYNLDVNWLRKCGHWDDNATYSFEEFCCILAEYHSQKKSVWKRLLDIARNVLPSGKDHWTSLLKLYLWM